MSNPVLRALVDLRDRQIQKARIQFGNRLAALEREADNPAESRQQETISRWLDVFEALEEDLDRDITSVVQEEPIFEHLSALRGIGPLLAAKIIAMIDIRRAPTVSALWRYAGYGVIRTGYRLSCGHEVTGVVECDTTQVYCAVCRCTRNVEYATGERERPAKGDKLHYNIRLKTTLYLVATSFLRSRSPYRQVYDDAKAYYESNRPEWTKLHVHQAAMRKMIKVFLAHLWEKWRSLEGLPTRALYVHERLGHTSHYRPEDFGW